MPFLPELEDLWEYGIKEKAVSMGWSCVRGDSISAPGFIVSQIHGQIWEADVVLGDMTGANPNVFYEVGYAVALGKPAVLVARSEGELTAFDTQGFRHHFHGNRIDRMKDILGEVLPEMYAELYEPQIKNSEVLYAWPSDEFPEPEFKWTGNEKSIDARGGQEIVDTSALGPIMRVVNTHKYWNWHTGQSIMRLGPSRRKTLSIGDRVHLIMEVKATAQTEFWLLGDGGRSGPKGEGPWANSWSILRFRSQAPERWSKEYVSVQVEPERPDYDPATKGTTLYLVTNTGTRSTEIKSLKLLCSSSD